MILAHTMERNTLTAFIFSRWNVCCIRHVYLVSKAAISFHAVLVTHLEVMLECLISSNFNKPFFKPYTTMKCHDPIEGTHTPRHERRKKHACASYQRLSAPVPRRSLFPYFLIVCPLDRPPIQASKGMPAFLDTEIRREGRRRLGNKVRLRGFAV